MADQITLDSPINDECRDAIEVSVDDLVEGSTVSAGVPLVNSSTSLNANCRSTYYDSPGVWYIYHHSEVNGSESLGAIRATTCDAYNYDTQLTVYRWDEACQTSGAPLECLDSNDDVGRGIYCSIVSFQAYIGQTYLILVHGALNQRGNFTLRLSGIPIPGNDDCRESVRILIGNKVLGSTVGASVDDPGDSCGGSGLSDSPGVWYSYLALEDGLMELATCADELDYDIQVSVFLGECEALMCLAKSAENLESRMPGMCTYTFFRATMGLTYSILVHGDSALTLGSGDFSMLMSKAQAPVNDKCENSTELSLNELQYGTTIASSVENFQESCNDGSTLDGRGVWYKYQSESVSSLIAKVCFSKNATGAEIGFYEGSCGTLSCVSSTRIIDTDPLCLALQIDTMVAQVVFLHVHTPADEIIDSFSLEFREFEIPRNDECENSLSIDVATMTLGTTVDATIDSRNTVDNCGGQVVLEGAGVWYSYTPNCSGEIEVSTCHSPASSRIELTVYEGNCTALVCVDHAEPNQSESCSSLRIPVVSGTIYSILVHGKVSGNFGLLVSLPPTNDDCEYPLFLETDDLVTGSTIAAKTDIIEDDCEGQVNYVSPGVWYSYLPSHYGILEVSTCNFETDFDTVLTVFRENCTELVCIATNDDHDSTVSLCSRVTLTVEAGVIYSILIHGFNSVGKYGVEIIHTDLETDGPTSMPSMWSSPSLSATEDFPASLNPSSTPSSFPSESKSPSHSSSRDPVSVVTASSSTGVIPAIFYPVFIFTLFMFGS